MSVEVRRAGPADAAALHEVAAATFRLACPPGTVEADMAEFVAVHLSDERMAAYLVDPARALFLAEVDGIPVGYTMLVSGEPTDAEAAAAITTRPTAEVSKCYVLPGHHGAGVASVLLSATIGAAIDVGASAIWLGVNQHNARANGFYEKQGFRIVGTKHFRVGSELHEDFVRERLL